jgi:serine phosphatase RsbU (regulator of sigma subunit)
VLDEPDREQGSVTLAPGDVLVTFSDGVLDLTGGTSERAVEQVEQIAREAGSAQEVVDGVLRLSLGAADRPDDLTVVAVRRDG